MLYDPNKPLVVQSNGVIVAEVNHDQFQIIQPILHQIASLQKVTTNAYTYQLSSYSIWSAQKLGIQFDEFINFLKEYCKFEVSQTIVQYIQDQYDRSLAVTMKKEGTLHTVRFSSTEIASILLKDKAVKKLLKRTEDAKTYEFELRSRGKLKSLFLECGFFTNDEIGYYQGEPLECTLKNVKLRPYQKEAVEKFYKYGKSDGGNGLVIMPCGSGKTIVGLGIIEKIKEEVLIITSNETSISQWKREIIDKTCLTEEQVGSYTSNAKQVRPITITSYQ
ncbi:MAG: helicase-associated domain-containing protein [Bacillaceae bacterium]|nr:helicase-associated domain-containing protein [Bacillaceae bacterium]